MISQQTASSSFQLLPSGAIHGCSLFPSQHFLSQQRADASTSFHQSVRQRASLLSLSSFGHRPLLHRGAEGCFGVVEMAQTLRLNKAEATTGAVESVRVHARAASEHQPPCCFIARYASDTWAASSPSSASTQQQADRTRVASKSFFMGDF